MVNNGKQIAVRLNTEELQALRKIPARTDSERLRILVQTEAVAGGLARQVSNELKNKFTAEIVAEVSAKVSADFRNAMGEMVKQLNIILGKR